MELYGIIHKILSKIIYTENFYIATADWDNNLIHFPYFVDQLDTKPDSKNIGNGLTEYVLKTGESILVDPYQYNNLLTSKKIIIGNNVIVGGGSMVTKNIPNNTMNYGIPSKVIKDL